MKKLRLKCFIGLQNRRQLIIIYGMASGVESSSTNR